MNKTLRLLLVLGSGVAIGAALGILYAPDEGYETRRKIVKRGKKLSRAVSDGIEEGSESLNEIKEALQKQMQKVNRRIEELKAH